MSVEKSEGKFYTSAFTSCGLYENPAIGKVLHSVIWGGGALEFTFPLDNTSLIYYYY